MLSSRRRASLPHGRRLHTLPGGVPHSSAVLPSPSANEGSGSGGRGRKMSWEYSGLQAIQLEPKCYIPLNILDRLLILIGCSHTPALIARSNNINMLEASPGSTCVWVYSSRWNNPVLFTCGLIDSPQSTSPPSYNNLLKQALSSVT